MIGRNVGKKVVYHNFFHDIYSVNREDHSPVPSDHCVTPNFKMSKYRLSHLNQWRPAKFRRTWILVNVWPGGCRLFLVILQVKTRHVWYCVLCTACLVLCTVYSERHVWYSVLPQTPWMSPHWLSAWDWWRGPCRSTPTCRGSLSGGTCSASPRYQTLSVRKSIIETGSGAEAGAEVGAEAGAGAGAILLTYHT